jgi:hypothetical protein
LSCELAPVKATPCGSTPTTPSNLKRIRSVKLNDGTKSANVEVVTERDY